MVGLQWCKDKKHREVDLNNHVDEILDEHLSKVAEGKVLKLKDIDNVIDDNFAIKIWVISVWILELDIYIDVSIVKTL